MTTLPRLLHRDCPRNGGSDLHHCAAQRLVGGEQRPQLLLEPKVKSPLSRYPKKDPYRPERSTPRSPNSPSPSATSKRKTRHANRSARQQHMDPNYPALSLDSGRASWFEPGLHGQRQSLASRGHPLARARVMHARAKQAQIRRYRALTSWSPRSRLGHRSRAPRRSHRPRSRRRGPAVCGIRCRA